MGTLTIRDLDDRTKQKLRERAAARGVSMEQEARTILDETVAASFGGSGSRARESFMESINRLKAKYGAFDIELPPRSTAVREPPTFD